MTLRLTLIRCPVEQGADRERSLVRGQITIGRAPDNDWVMQDPDRVLSKNHCIVEKRGGGFVVVDTSTNGVFLNHSSEPIGRGNAAVLSSGDQIQFGAFHLGVSVEEDSARPSSLGAQSARDAGAGAVGLPPIDERDPFDLPIGPRRASGPLPLDDEDGPFNPPEAGRAWGATAQGWGDGTDADHAPAEHLAMPVIAAGAGVAIPDDWDEDEAALAGDAPALAAGAHVPLSKAAPAVAPSAIPDDWDDLALEPVAAAAGAPAAPETTPAAAAFVESRDTEDDPADDSLGSGAVFASLQPPAATSTARDRLPVRDSFVASLIIRGSDEADLEEDKQAYAASGALAPRMTMISPAGQAASQAAPELMAITRALATALLSLQRARETRLAGKGVEAVSPAPPADLFSTALDGVEVVERLLALGPAGTADAVRKLLEVMLTEPHTPAAVQRTGASDLDAW